MMMSSTIVRRRSCAGVLRRGGSSSWATAAGPSRRLVNSTGTDAMRRRGQHYNTTVVRLVEDRSDMSRRQRTTFSPSAASFTTTTTTTTTRPSSSPLSQNSSSSSSSKSAEQQTPLSIPWMRPFSFLNEWLLLAANKFPKGFDDFFPPNSKNQPNEKPKQSEEVVDSNEETETTTSNESPSSDPKKESTTSDQARHASSSSSSDQQQDSKKQSPPPPPPPPSGDDDAANLPGLVALLLLVLMLRSLTEQEGDDSKLGQEITYVDFRKLLQKGAVEKLVVVNKKLAKVVLKDNYESNATVTTTAAATTWKDEDNSGDDNATTIVDWQTAAQPSQQQSKNNKKKQNNYYFYIGSVESLEEKLTQSQQDAHPQDWVQVQYVSQTQWGLEALKALPLLAFFAALYFGTRGAMGGLPGGSSGSGSSARGGGGASGGIFGIGRSTAKKISKEDVNVTFADVAGCQQAKMEIMEFVDFLKDSERFTKLGAKIPKGALLTGPPGTGKTLLAKAVAGQAGVPFYSVSGSDFIEMFVGVGPSRVRDLFKEARANAPCIVFIDEIDAVGRQRGRGGFSGGNDERENTLNQLLVEMDGFSPTTGVVVLAGTNRVDILDQALTRPGRFDRQITVDRPDLQGRKEIFEVHLQGITLEGSIDEYAGRLAGLTPGFAGADIANLCNEAAIVAARRKADAVSMQDFEKATDRIIGGLESNKIMSDEERSIVAHHEAGHAIAGWFLEHADPLLKVTIIPRTSGALGFAQYLPKEVFLRSQEQIMDIVCMALAGRAAEEVFFGRVTTGASDDLRRVTQLVYGMIKDFGMNSRVGQLSFPSNDMAGPGEKPYSDSTAEAMDDEARAIVDAAYQRTLELVREHKDDIDQLAKLLLEKETITHDDITDTVGPRPFEADSAYQEFVSHRASAKKKGEEPAEDQNDDKEKDETSIDSNDGLTPGLA